MHHEISGFIKINWCIICISMWHDFDVWECFDHGRVSLGVISPLLLTPSTFCHWTISDNGNLNWVKSRLSAPDFVEAELLKRYALMRVIAGNGLWWLSSEWSRKSSHPVGEGIRLRVTEWEGRGREGSGRISLDFEILSWCSTAE